MTNNNTTEGDTMNNELLNKMRDMLVDQANSEGVELSSIFKNNEDLNNWIISKAIQLVKAQGKTIEEAYDFVLGAGAYKGLAD